MLALQSHRSGLGIHSHLPQSPPLPLTLPRVSTASLHFNHPTGLSPHQPLQALCLFLLVFTLASLFCVYVCVCIHVPHCAWWGQRTTEHLIRCSVLFLHVYGCVFKDTYTCACMDAYTCACMDTCSCAHACRVQKRISRALLSHSLFRFLEKSSLI